MAKYTTQIRSLVESNINIFDFDYPLFDPKYKPVLEKKIIDHYYFREIGLETPGQFKHFLKAKLNKIMPYYNDLYKSIEDFKTQDPYINKNVTTTDTRDSTSSGSGSASAKGSGSMKGNSQNVFSETPQAKLQGLDYATNLTDTENTNSDTSESSSSNSNSFKSTDEYISTIKGFDGMKYAAGVLIELRESFINVDEMIIEDLNDLFMNIY